VATVIDTLITKFGFETDKTGLNKAEKGLSDFKGAAIKVAAAVGSVIAGGFFLKAIAEAADETLKWADANGIVIESLGTLEFAVQRQGGTVDGLRASLSNMNKSIGEVQRGTGRAKLAFEDYGLSIYKANGQVKTADELLIDLNKKFATLSKAQQFDLAMKMGIDKGTIRLLQTAPDEIARLRMEAARLGVLSRQDAVKAAEFVDGMTNIAQSINAIKFEIGGFFFKPIADFFKVVANGIAYMREHKSFFLTLIGIIAAIGLAYKAMAIRAALAWVIALGPALVLPALIALIIAALALLIDDFRAFFNGQSSAIGDMIKKWPVLGDIIKVWVEIFKILFSVASAGFKLLKKLVLDVGKDIVEFFFGPIEDGSKIFDSLSDAAGATFSTILDWLLKVSEGINEFLLDPMKSVMEAIGKVSSFGGKIGGKIGKLLGIGQVELQPLQPLPVGALSPASHAFNSDNRIVKQSTNLKVGDINIDARGGDSKEIAQNVNSALSDQLKNTVEDFDSTRDK